jgi:hypothetical protein
MNPPIRGAIGSLEAVSVGRFCIRLIDGLNCTHNEVAEKLSSHELTVPVIEIIFAAAQTAFGTVGTMPP